MSLLTDLMKQKYSNEDRYSTLSGGQPQPVQMPSLPSVSPIGQTTPQNDWRSGLKEKQELANLRNALGSVEKLKSKGPLTYSSVMSAALNSGIPVNIAHPFSSKILAGQEKTFAKQKEADRIKNINLGFQEVLKAKEQNDGKPLSFEQRYSILSKYMDPNTALAFTKVIDAEQVKREKKDTFKYKAEQKLNQGIPLSSLEKSVLGITTEKPKETTLIENWRAAVAGGYKGTLEDWKKVGKAKGTDQIAYNKAKKTAVDAGLKNWRENFLSADETRVTPTFKESLKKREELRKEYDDFHKGTTKPAKELELVISPTGQEFLYDSEAGKYFDKDGKEVDPTKGVEKKKEVDIEEKGKVKKTTKELLEDVAFTKPKIETDEPGYKSVLKAIKEVIGKIPDTGATKRRKEKLKKTFGGN